MKLARIIPGLAMLAGGIFSANAQATNLPTPVFTPVEILEAAAAVNPDTLASHQFITPGAPAAPQEFNPDSGVPQGRFLVASASKK